MLQTRRLCLWCKGFLLDGSRSDAKFCSQHCRQASHRFAVRRSPRQATDRAMSFAYADPPYPGKANYYPEKTEVDHADLIRRLQLQYPDGWALSTSSEASRDVWQLCPEARLCVWVKAPRQVKSYRVVSSWEALFVAGGRQRREAVAEDLSDCLIYQGRHRAFPGALIGMKPPAFAEWMFRLLGAQEGDSLDDLFPGSGAIGEAWRRYADPQATIAMKVVAQAGERYTSLPPG